MTFFIKNSNNFTIAPDGSVDIRDHLPVGTYIVKFDAKGNFFYLEIAEAFGKLPSKVYGTTTATAERILTTYQSREVSTGVLLAGEKGSGKTMLAKMLSVMAAERGVPTLIINTPFVGDGFNKFIQDIDQECMIMFDEFEKVYTTDEDGNDPQEQLLTLLDGVFPQKKLFVLTCNAVSQIDEHLINRPGRIFYFLEYKGVDEQFITEYLHDNLNDKSQIESFVSTVKTLFDCFNFDMMKALVEEMNRFNETLREVMVYTNTRPSYSYAVDYDVEVEPLNGSREVKTLYNKQLRGNPLATEHEVNFKVVGDGDDRYCIDLLPKTLVNVDIATGVFVYRDKGYTVTLARSKADAGFDYMNAF